MHHMPNADAVSVRRELEKKGWFVFSLPEGRHDRIEPIERS
jgi:hypothetical protein